MDEIFSDEIFYPIISASPGTSRPLAAGLRELAPPVPLTSQEVFPPTQSSSSHTPYFTSSDVIPPVGSLDAASPFQESVDPLIVSPALTVLPRRSGCVTQPPVRYGFMTLPSGSGQQDNPSYSQAMSGPERSIWLKAMEAEVEAFN